MPQNASTLRVLGTTGSGDIDVEATLIAADEDAAPAYAAHAHLPGAHLLLSGDRDFYVVLSQHPGTAGGESRERVSSLSGQSVLAQFAGRSAVRRQVKELAIVDDAAAADVPTAPQPVLTTSGDDAQQGALDLIGGLRGAAPLFLHADGALAEKAEGPAPEGAACLNVFVTAARWISSRRTSTFECLFPPSAFHPDEPLRKERLTAEQAVRLVTQCKGALAAAAVEGGVADLDAQSAAQLRSATLTVLSHILATVRKDESFRAVADSAAATIFELIDKEKGNERARPALRSHAIQLLQLRGPALSPSDRQRAATLLQTLIRQAPPYAELAGTWRFAMCSAWDFHDGECEILLKRYSFTEQTTLEDAPAPPRGMRYRILEAPFKTPAGHPIQIFSRVASPRDENIEMGSAAFVGMLINRHAQLGSFDMQASASEVHQAGYKLMMNSQCAGLTTRFAIAKMFPDADIYSSWDSTYFRTNSQTGKVSDSEGIDCFVELLKGMSQSETHAQLSERMRKVQWYHEQATHSSTFCQFVGPAHPLVVARYADVNQDGRADYYDGYLDLALKEIKSDLENSATPRDPGVAVSQISGDAAKGLGWAAGSLNRVTQYSDLWRGLPGDSALFYIFAAGGFFSHREPPRDVPASKDDPYTDLGRLPAVSRYTNTPDESGKSDLSVDVMFHSHLAHAAWELKRLLSAADAHRRALDLGLLPSKGLLSTPLGQRGALLLTLAGLLEFPADQNFIDGLWSIALRMLNLPPVSRSLIRSCITQADHDASNYYGSMRGLRQLIGDGTDKNPGELKKADAVAYGKLSSPDATIGRCLLLTLPE